MFVVSVVFNVSLHQSSATAELAHSVAPREFSLSSGRCRSVTHFSSVISENINVNDLLSETRFLGLNYCRRQYTSVSNLRNLGRN